MIGKETDYGSMAACLMGCAFMSPVKTFVLTLARFPAASLSRSPRDETVRLIETSFARKDIGLPLFNRSLNPASSASRRTSLRSIWDAYIVSIKNSVRRIVALQRSLR